LRIEVIMLTLEELLASVLLEERLVHDRAREIIDHEQEDRLDLLLRVASVVCNSCVLEMSAS